MNNAAPISPDFYNSRLELFAPGMAEHITPIKYEVVTPDMSLLAFRTVGRDGTVYYFALLQYDYLYSIKHATKVIGAQFAKVAEFIPPVVKQKGRTELEQKSVAIPKTAVHLLLARTERPAGKGYWATYIQIMPGDDIPAKLESLPEKDKPVAEKLVQEVLKKHLPTGTPRGGDDFLASWSAKQTRAHATIKDLKTNDTNLGIHIFKNAIGNWESFYNYVDRANQATKDKN